SGDQTVRWWEAATGKELRSRRVDPVSDILALSPDGRILACQEKQREIHLRDGVTGKEVRVLGGHEETIGSLAFAAGGRVLAPTGYSESSVQLGDVGAGERWRALDYEAPSAVASHVPPLLAVSPDGRTLAVQGPKGTVHLWEAATGKKRLRVR